MQMRCDIVANLYPNTDLTPFTKSEQVFACDGAYYLDAPYKGRLGCSLYRGLRKNGDVVQSVFMCLQATTLEQVIAKLQQRDYRQSEIDETLAQMLAWSKFKPAEGWNLVETTSLSDLSKVLKLQIVSEFDFKRRLVYSELDTLFERTFAQQLVDTNQLLMDFGIKCQPESLNNVLVLDPGRLLLHMEGQKRVEIDLKRTHRVEAPNFYRVAPLDTWAIFVQDDNVPLAQKMLQIFGQLMVEIDRDSVTKAPKIFHVPPRKWHFTLQEQVIPEAQVVVLIAPKSADLPALATPTVIVDQDKLKGYLTRDKQAFETTCWSALRRALIRSGSHPFIQSQMPFFDNPVCLIGLSDPADLKCVASLDKSLSRFHTKRGGTVQEAITECLAVFKESQNIGAKYVFVFADFDLQSAEANIKTDSQFWESSQITLLQVSASQIWFNSIARDLTLQEPKRGTCVEREGGFVLALHKCFYDFKVTQTQVEGEQAATELRTLCLRLANMDLMASGQAPANLMVDLAQRLGHYEKERGASHAAAQNQFLYFI